MKIIEQGQLPADFATRPNPSDVFEGKCSRCSTVVQFRRDEARSWGPGECLGVRCPTCRYHSTISVSEKMANQAGGPS